MSACEGEETGKEIFFNFKLREQLNSGLVQAAKWKRKIIIAHTKLKWGERSLESRVWTDDVLACCYDRKFINHLAQIFLCFFFAPLFRCFQVARDAMQSTDSIRKWKEIELSIRCSSNARARSHFSTGTAARLSHLRLWLGLASLLRRRSGWWWLFPHTYSPPIQRWKINWLFGVLCCLCAVRIRNECCRLFAMIS